MQFSLNQIRSLINKTTEELDDKTIIDKLTSCGFEVEEVLKLASGSKLTTGKIIECVKHPDSDHLHILKVDCGKKHGILNIVCGAPNARVGIKVIVALDGCFLPFLNKTIQAGSIRGQKSEGMCCSLIELGVNKNLLESDSKSIDGIEELQDKIKIGDDNILKTLLLDDTILDINVLPNRPDCLSYLGICREILSEFKINENIVFEKFDRKPYKNNVLKVKILSKSISRAAMIQIDKIKVKKETPLNIKRTLQASNIRPISPIVDLGNYVMLITGQPINMYDSKKNINGSYIFQDDLNTEFITFDKKRIQLQNQDIVITDENNRILCLAGIVAGEDSMVDDSTNSIVIELASFYHANIRRTSSRIGITTFSSNLFSKGRNPNMIDEAINYLFNVLPLFFDKFEVSCIKDVNNLEKQDTSIKFSLTKLNKRLGTNFSKEYVDEILKSYRIKITKDGSLIPPIDRIDLKEQCDIDEEVFRNSSFDDFKLTLDNTPITKGGLTTYQEDKRKVRELLVSKGLNEILSFTLISKEEFDSINTFNDLDPYIIKNPMTKDHEVVRTSLLPSMMSTLKFNISHQNNDLALFEVSCIDDKKGVKTYLSIGLHGSFYQSELSNAHEYDFFYLKGLFESILIVLGINQNRINYKYSVNPKFHKSASCDVYMDNKFIGTFGKIDPQFDKTELYLLEIDLGFLLDAKRSKSKFKTYSLYPEVRRDISIKCNDELNYITIKNKLLHLKNCCIIDIKLFDQFIDQDQKYIGLAIFLGKSDGTLNDDEINTSLNEIKRCLKEDMHLVIRGE